MKKALVVLLGLPFLLGISNYKLASFPRMEFASSINDNGDIVGIEIDGQKSVAYIDGQRYYLGDTVIEVTDINNIGQVVGHLLSGEGFIWEAGSITRVLLPLPGYPEAYPYDINNDGVVVGVSKNGTALSGTIWIPGEEVRSVPLRAYAVNDNGNVFGPWQSYASVGIYNYNTDTLDTVIEQLYGFSQRSANELDQFVGNSYPDGYLWTGDGVYYFEDEASILDVNDYQQAVGFVKSPFTLTFRAVVLEDGKLYDLNYYITNSYEHRLGEARAINNAGQIIAVGQVAGVDSNTFLLTPTTDPINPPPGPEGPPVNISPSPETSFFAAVMNTTNFIQATVKGYIPLEAPPSEEPEPPPVEEPPVVVPVPIEPEPETPPVVIPEKPIVDNTPDEPSVQPTPEPADPVVNADKGSSGGGGGGCFIMSTW